MLTIGEMYAIADLGELTTLLDENRLPGQPPVTKEMVRATFSRKASVDQWYYEQLRSTRILAVRTQENRLVGAAAFGDTHRGVRDLLWLTARESSVISALVEEVFRAWNGPSRAFWYASTISAGLEGLPRTHHGKVHDVLVNQGFTGHDFWSYQMLKVATPCTKSDVTFTKHNSIANADGVTVAEYEIEIPFEGLGVFWWLEVKEEHRGLGYGRKALVEALETLTTNGVTEVILYVDDDDISGERDRRPAKALYASAGFREIDRLWSYSRGDVPREGQVL